MDIRSAYDNVRRSILVNILQEKKCPEKMKKFVSEWMKDRKTRFIIQEDEIVERSVNKGLPQGGVLSPLLYSHIHSQYRKGNRK